MANVEQVDQGAHIGLAEAVAFQRDLYLYWREASSEGGLPLTTRGFVNRPVMRRIRAARAQLAHLPGDTQATTSDLAESDDLPLLYLRRLLERLGLLRVSSDGSRLLAAERSEMARFAALPLAERLRVCARLWVAGGWWPDRPSSGAELPRVLAPAPPRLALARRRVLEMLAAREVGERVAIPHAPLTKRKAAGSQRRSETDSRFTRVGNDADDETLRAALLGPLAWMGFVAPDDATSATARASGASTCRAGVGLAALRADRDGSDAESELRETPGRVVIQADLSIFAYPPFTAPLLATLDICADVEALDVTARYRLSRAALTRAVQAGYDAAGVARRLESLSGAPLPDAVRVALVDWERHAERVRLLPTVTLLEVRKPALLDAMLTDRSAREWVERRLTPTAALLAPGCAPRVRAWLLRRGEFPAVVAHDGELGDGELGEG
jgi:hypothetical protein